jgi:hypothetical protein
MNRVLRLALSLTLGALACFSIFGFLATFEPLDQATRMTWRVVYSVLFIASVAGFFMLNLPRRDNRSDDK